MPETLVPMLDRYLLTHGPFRHTDFMPRRKAQHNYDLWRSMYGLNPGAPITSAPGSVSKLDLSLAMGIRTYSLALAQAKTSGVNTCGNHTEGCFMNCVGGAGHGSRPSVKKARKVKTLFFATDPLAAYSLWYHELAGAAMWCQRNDWKMALRGDDYSDIRHEIHCPDIFDLPLQAYDYTKLPPVQRRHGPSNLHLTWSWDERRNPAWVRKHLEAGRNVAIPFRAPKHQLPTSWHGMEVIDGDLTDYRPHDKRGVIVGLSAKNGAMHGNYTGFVVEPTTNQGA